MAQVALVEGRRHKFGREPVTDISGVIEDDAVFVQRPYTNPPPQHLMMQHEALCRASDHQAAGVWRVKSFRRDPHVAQDLYLS
jgi:hypothetical protein